MRLSKKRTVFAVIFGVLTVATLCFIWGNSLLSKEASASGSGEVYDKATSIIARIFGEGFYNFLTSFIDKAVFRKIIHFLEFSALGAEICALFITVFTRAKFTLKNFCFICLFGLFSGAVDELLQIISDRGPRIKDVLLDFCGYLFAAAIFFIVCAAKNRKDKKAAKLEESETLKPPQTPS